MIEMIERLRLEREARRAELMGHLAAGVLEFRHHRSSMWAALSREPGGGRWRLTTYSADGLLGHYFPAEPLAEGLERDGFTEPDPGSMDRLSAGW